MKRHPPIRTSSSGYNESEIARRLCLSPSHIHRVLTGERPASPRLRLALRNLGIRVG